MLVHSHFHTFGHAHVLAVLLLLVLGAACLAAEERAARAIGLVVIVIALLALCGCSTLEAGIQQPAEQSWQALHAIDTLQTERVTTDHCFRERETAFELGAHPNQAQVAAWGVTAAVFHDFVSGWLAENDHPRILAAWQVVSLADTGYDVVNNFHIGIRVGAPNVRPAGCT